MDKGKKSQVVPPDCVQELPRISTSVSMVATANHLYVRPPRHPGRLSVAGSSGGSTPSCRSSYFSDCTVVLADRWRGGREGLGAHCSLGVVCMRVGPWWLPVGAFGAFRIAPELYMAAGFTQGKLPAWRDGERGRDGRCSGACGGWWSMAKPHPA